MSSKTNVLIVGGGGREHALAWKLRQSPRAGDIYIAPKSAGTRLIAENIFIPIADHQKLATFARHHNVHLAVIGPDKPLADGIVDVFRSYGIPTFGPTKSAMIESSKIAAKELMRSKNIPTADFKAFSDHKSARAYIEYAELPLVIKADGLALGKGVYVCDSRKEARQALHLLMVDRIHGEAGERVIIEKYLAGFELSIHALSDDKDAAFFPASRDYKRLGDGNTGPNTGGMGAITSAEFGQFLMDGIREDIANPALAALCERGSPFVGCFYPGIMLTKNGPMALEFNARFGDPETQCYMRILKSDLLDLIEACINGTIASQSIEWEPRACVSVVLASEGYPYEPKLGRRISGIERAEEDPDVVVFHAGTAYDEKKKLITSGGRVLTVTATAPTFLKARECAYEAVKKIHFDGMQYRTDIGLF